MEKWLCDCSKKYCTVKKILKFNIFKSMSYHRHKHKEICILLCKITIALMLLLLSPTNLAAEKLTAFILCSAHKKELANLLTFAVLNHSIQVYLSAFKRIREPDIWNWTQFIDWSTYLIKSMISGPKNEWPLNLLVFRLTVLFQE